MSSRTYEQEARGDSTNFNSVGCELARLHLRQIVLGLLDKSGLSAAQIAGIGLGVSGVSRPEDQQMVATWVADVLPDTCLVENDALMAQGARYRRRAFRCGGQTAAQE